MDYIKIAKTGKYLPGKEIDNNKLEKTLGLESGYIYKRTGIKERYYTQETIEEMAVKAVQNMMNKEELVTQNIGLIIVATTTTNKLMPGISNKIQKECGINRCICLDILAGCSGYINAFDIARMHIQTGIIEKALIVGVDILSKYTDNKDIGTSIILSDGAGATLIERTAKKKIYNSHIEAESENNEILTCTTNQKISMNGKEIYRYAVTETVKNIEQLLKQSNEELKNIKYIIPHQSNMKIMKAIASRLNIKMDKVYTNIKNTGNTFCASIPIVLDEMIKKKLLNDGDKIILLGYGGGLNTGSILLEI